MDSTKWHKHADGSWHKKNTGLFSVLNPDHFLSVKIGKPFQPNNAENDKSSVQK